MGGFLQRCDTSRSIEGKLQNRDAARLPLEKTRRWNLVLELRRDLQLSTSQCFGEVPPNAADCWGLVEILHDHMTQHRLLLGIRGPLTEGRMTTSSHIFKEIPKSCNCSRWRRMFGIASVELDASRTELKKDG